MNSSGGRASLDKLLNGAIHHKASDIRISTNGKPWLRIDGQWKKLEMDRPLSAEEVNAMMLGIMSEQRLVSLNEGHEQDLRFEYNNTGLRVNAYKDHNGPAMVIRLLSPKMPELDSLGLPPKVRELANAEKGLFLVTGATGSGKSTSLAAIINDLNKTSHHHIITIEDPIEYVHEPKNALITQREVGSDTHSYAKALKAALRQAPNVILIGELRDRETAIEALHAAETGHLVFATVHAGSAAQGAERIVGMFPPEDQSQIRTSIADNLVGVLTQQLLPRADGQGRVAAAELLVATPAIKHQVKEGKIPAIISSMQTGASKGMVTMGTSLKTLAESGAITAEVHKRGLQEYQRAIGGSEQSRSV